MTSIKSSVIRFALAVLILCTSLALWVYFVYFVALDNTRFNGERITGFGLRNEILLLINFGLLIFLLSKRILLSLLLAVISYSIFIIINLEKIKFYNSPVLPLDFHYLSQLVLLWPAFKLYFFIFFGFVFTIIALILIFKKFEPRNHFLLRSSKFKFSIIFTFVFFVSIKISGLYNDMVYTLAKDGRGRAHLVYTSERDGLLTTFVRNYLHISANKSPENYSKNKILEIYNDKIVNEKLKIVSSHEKINLVIYLIESFIDPQSLDIESTRDPIPFFHHIQKEFESGYVYSPVIGGRSANAEFEILTGFSKHFFDPASIPFIDLPQREIPSIANELKREGYFTKVIQAANLDFFNYKVMYDMLGFDEIVSLDNKKEVPLDIAGRYPSDIAIVNEIIKSAENKDNFFLYAFPNSTHGLWDYDAYDNSDLNLNLSQPLNNSKGEKDLKTYLNSLHTADQAIKKLIQHFEQKNQKTVILILGDHQPGMPEIIEQYMFKKFPNRFSNGDRIKLKKQFNKFHKENLLESYEIMHKVPYVLWTNIKTTKVKGKNRGMNELATRIFQLINHQPQSDFYRFMETFVDKAQFSDILRYVFLHEEKLEPDKLDWIKSYEQLQFDILLGGNYIKEIGANK